MVGYVWHGCGGQLILRFHFWMGSRDQTKVSRLSQKVSLFLSHWLTLRVKYFHQWLSVVTSFMLTQNPLHQQPYSLFRLANHGPAWFCKLAFIGVRPCPLVHAKQQS